MLDISNEQYLCSCSCLIDEGEKFLLTGGRVMETEKKVARYDINGWVEDLDDLNTERYAHGCTRYTNSAGDKVRIECVMNSLV